MASSAMSLLRGVAGAFEEKVGMHALLAVTIGALYVLRPIFIY